MSLWSRHVPEPEEDLFFDDPDVEYVDGIEPPYVRQRSLERRTPSGVMTDIARLHPALELFLFATMLFWGPIIVLMEFVGMFIDAFKGHPDPFPYYGSNHKGSPW